MTSLQTVFETNPLSMFLTECRKQSKLLAMHITGRNMKDQIQVMDEFETEQKKNLRQKYSRSNRDIFRRIHGPIDKVFTANGGSLLLNLPESQQKTFNSFLSDIRKGMSLRKWVQQVAMAAYHIDPNGLIFVEIDTKGRPYPVYKSTSDIFYYETNGRLTDVIIFQLSKSEYDSYIIQQPELVAKWATSNLSQDTKYYRYVDDTEDKIITWSGNKVTEVPGLTLPNLFNQCPGMLISNLFEFDTNMMLSPDADIVELANSLLTDNSVFEIWKKLHMFPKHWRVQSVCPKCQGTKTVGGITCTDCEGTGFQQRSSVRDEIIVALPDAPDGKISLPTAFDGYTSPSTDAWTLATDDSDRLFNQMFQTKWGYLPTSNKPQGPSIDKGNKTATQVLDESYDKSAKLYDYSEWCETVETFIINLCGLLMYGNSYTGCSVNYGDRYILEGPDTLWNKYANARTEGASEAILDRLLLDYYESKYYSDPIGLQIAVKQMRVEPWVHSTIAQVLSFALTDLDKGTKMYFSEWASTLTDMDWLAQSEQVLRIALIKYATPKVLAVIKEKNDAILFERQIIKPTQANPPAN